ncbi:MAG: sugar phosphate nucleotidyltransferase [Defluviitaleaceae bacterium]|nr:sugar phosphate nucleotidyltransferase [Defluviitaleaceae bacterium]
MYPLTLNQPKALLPLNGKPIINFILDQINTLPNVNEIVVVSNHKFYPQFELWAKNVESKSPVSVLNDGTTTEDNRLGAIGDIHFTLRVKDIDEDIVVIAGDNYMTYPLSEQYQLFKEKQSDVVCGQRLNDRKLLSRLAVATLDDNNKILSLVEKPEDPPSDVAIFATYFYQKETLPLFSKYLQEGEIPDAPGYFVQWLYNKKDVYTYIMNGECYDIGTIEAYDTMQKDMEAGKYGNQRY